MPNLLNEFLFKVRNNYDGKQDWKKSYVFISYLEYFGNNFEKSNLVHVNYY